MSDQAFQRDAEAALDAIEAAMERAADGDLDVDVERQGNVITMTFEDDSKVIVNSHSAAQEIWVAARSGGFHYRLTDGRWIDGRSGDELFAALSRLVSQQGGLAVVLAPR
ncbi:MAG: iron donor protein CyaY [Burkholderiales bacterium]|jgi:CyaY protein